MGLCLYCLFYLPGFLFIRDRLFKFVKGINIKSDRDEVDFDLLSKTTRDLKAFPWLYSVVTNLLITKVDLRCCVNPVTRNVKSLDRRQVVTVKHLVNRSRFFIPFKYYFRTQP